MSPYLPAHRRLLALAATALAVTLPTSLLQTPAVAQPTLPTVMDLPDNWLPEGIAVVGHTAYLGSLADGDIYRMDLRTGDGVELTDESDNNPAVGLKARDGLLYIAGGATRTGPLVDPGPRG